MDLTGVTFDTTTVGAAGLLLIGALATIWAIKEGISMFRSRK